MDSFVEKELGLFQQSSAENHDSGGSVSDLVVLGQRRILADNSSDYITVSSQKDG